MPSRRRSSCPAGPPALVRGGVGCTIIVALLAALLTGESLHAQEQPTPAITQPTEVVPGEIPPGYVAQDIVIRNVQPDGSLGPAQASTQPAARAPVGAGAYPAGWPQSWRVLPPPPAADDFTVASLKKYQQLIGQRYGGDRDIPLDVKAAYFEWMMWHYARSATGQIFDRLVLEPEPNARPMLQVDSDGSTWNGALMGALAYKYAVAREPQTLESLAELLRGLRACLEVTGKRGHIARGVLTAAERHPSYDDSLEQERIRLRPGTWQGQEVFYRPNPAKGTYNQVVAGYARLLMLVGDDLPPDVRQMAHDDLTSMVLHVIDHDYKLTDAAGNRSPYGDMTPVVATVGVPFNAQVAYMVLAAGQYFCWPEPETGERARIEAHFHRLRYKHHPYYERGLPSLLSPQGVVSNPFTQNMNDRMHAAYAAFVSLEMDLEYSRKHGVPRDKKFIYQMGQTLHNGRSYFEQCPNSLAHFMWLGLIQDEDVRGAIVEHRRNTALHRAEQALQLGVENLRRFPMSRFYTIGRNVNNARAVWADACEPGYLWHRQPLDRWETTGEETPHIRIATDFLHAYWLFRYYRLDQQLAVRDLPVLRRSGDWASHPDAAHP